MKPKAELRSFLKKLSQIKDDYDWYIDEFGCIRDEDAGFCPITAMADYYGYGYYGIDEEDQAAKELNLSDPTKFLIVKASDNIDYPVTRKLILKTVGL